VAGSLALGGAYLSIVSSYYCQGQTANAACRRRDLRQLASDRRVHRSAAVRLLRRDGLLSPEA
jgi:hypothetical protein